MRGVAVLDRGSGDDDGEQQSVFIHSNVSLDAVRSLAAQPRLDRGTVSAAGTVCESMIAAVGHRSCPSRTRRRSRSVCRGCAATGRCGASGRRPRTPSGLAGTPSAVAATRYHRATVPARRVGGHDGDGGIGDDLIVGSWCGRGLGTHRPNQEPAFFDSQRGTRPRLRVLKHPLRSSTPREQISYGVR